MKEVPINAKIDGQDRVISIDADPSWGKLQELLKALIVIDGNGKQRTDINGFLNKILQLVIISGFDEVKDPIKLALISGDEITAILGEILKIIPLQKYSKNLGENQFSLLGNLS